MLAHWRPAGYSEADLGCCNDYFRLGGEKSRSSETAGVGMKSTSLWTTRLDSNECWLVLRVATVVHSVVCESKTRGIRLPRSFNQRWRRPGRRAHRVTPFASRVKSFGDFFFPQKLHTDILETGKVGGDWGGGRSAGPQTTLSCQPWTMLSPL